MTAVPRQPTHSLLQQARRASGWLVVCCLAATATVPAQAQDRPSLRGVVVDSATGAAIADAEISIPGSDQRAHSGADGRFTLPDAGIGQLSLFVRAVGYAPILVYFAADTTTELRIALAPMAVELEEIEVVADPLETMLRSERSVLMLDEAAINEGRGQTLGETLREAPGVAVITYGPGIAKPVVRGLHSHRIVTFNRGVRQEGQQWGGEHAPEVDIFDTDQIQVIRGSASVLYGSDALGGAILIEPGPLSTLNRVTGEAVVNLFANNGQGAASVMAETGGLDLPLLGQAGLRLRGSARVAGDAAAPDYNINNTGFRELNGSLTFGVNRRWGRSEIILSTFNTELGLYTGAHVGNLDDLQRAIERGPRPSEFSYEILPPRQEVSHNTALWRGLVTTTEAGAFEWNLSYQLNNRREYDNHGPLAERDIPAFALKLYTYTGDVRWHHKPLGPLVGTIGVSGINQSNLSLGKSFLIPQYWLNTGAVYIEETLPLGRLSLSGGLRYEYRWQRVFDYRIGGFDFPGEERSYDGLAGSLAGVVQLGSGWSLASSVGSGWRAPNVSERFSLGVHHGTAQYEIGDTTLVPERNLNADLTLRHVGPHAAFEISGYRNQIDGYIYLHPRAPVQTIRGAFPAFEYRQTDAVLYGVDAAFQVVPVRRVQLDVGLSVVRGNNQALNEPLHDQPADRITASARYLFALGHVRGAYAQLGGTFVRRQDQVPSELVYDLPTAGYALAHVTVGVDEIQLGSTPVSISLAVRNLFDTAYRDYLSRYRLFIDDPGRDVILRLRAMW